MKDGPGDGAIDARMLERVRQVDWVNFGGVLIRRHVIEACGGFDARYEWAYMMDVDYCLEARLRGFRLYQVPCRLQHEESRTTAKLWDERPELREQVDENRKIFFEKWKPFVPALPSIVDERRVTGTDASVP